MVRSVPTKKKNQRPAGHVHVHVYCFNKCYMFIVYGPAGPRDDIACGHMPYIFIDRHGMRGAHSSVVTLTLHADLRPSEACRATVSSVGNVGGSLCGSRSASCGKLRVRSRQSTSGRRRTSCRQLCVPHGSTAQSSSTSCAVTTIDRDGRVSLQEPVRAPSSLDSNHRSQG